MGYSMPIVCKELYLPIAQDDELNLDEYKDKYGIDLSKYVHINGPEIAIRFPILYKVYLVALDYENICPVGLINNFTASAYESGSTNAETSIMCTDLAENAGFGIRLVVNKDDDLTIDNIKIFGYAL